MKRNNLIEALRGLLIIWIILFHYTVRYEELFQTGTRDIVHFENGGEIGVLMFFVISGYFFYKSYLSVSDEGIKSFAKFIGNKYWRLWPAYIISVVIVFVVVKIFNIGGGREAGYLDLIGDIFIWHPGFKFVDGAHWFLSALIISQCVISIGIISNRVKVVWTDLTMALGLLIFLLSEYTDLKVFDIICTHLYVKDFLMFLLGVYMWKWLNQKSRKGMSITLLLSIYFSFFYSTLLVVAYLSLFTVLIREKKYSNKVPHFAIYAGDVSFCWYLVHQNLGYIVIDQFENPTLGIVTALIISFILASILYNATKKIPTKIFK